MTRKVLLVVAVACATIAGVMSLSIHIVHGQSTAYNPYPPGILPSNIDSELARVLREINFIETEAIGQWQALPPPTLAGNPPILQNNGEAAVEYSAS